MDVHDYAGFLGTVRMLPDQIRLGSAGRGTVSHLAIELLQARTFVHVNHLPFPGTSAALEALLAGKVDALFLPVKIILPQVKSGKLHALAVAAPQRDPALPDMPTFTELEFLDFRVGDWYGMFAPKATPDDILDSLHAAVQTALAEDDVQRIWAEQGASVAPESRLAFATFVALEVQRWGRIAKTVNIPAQ